MSRTLRRTFVIIGYAIPLFIFGTGRYEQGGLSGWSLLLIPALLLLLRLASFSGGVLEKAQGAHDERQRELVLRSYSVTYRIVIVSILLTVLLYMFGEMGTGLFEFFFFASFYLTFFLPATVIVWLEPDPIQERERNLREA